MNEHEMDAPQEALTPLEEIELEKEEPVKPRRLPLVFFIFYGFFALSLVLFLVALFQTPFADGLNRTYSAAVRGTLAHLTSWIPFSLGEYLLLLSPLILGILIALGVKKYASSWRTVGRYCVCLFSVLALIGGIFLSAFAPAYHTTTLDVRLGLDKQEVSVDELYLTADYLILFAEQESAQVSYGTDGFSTMPYSHKEMNDKLLASYASLSEEYDFLPKLKSRVKPVMLSKAMSYTHTTGIYSFFTGEANLNVDFPDYTLPFTAAHELAHQRGIAREDEANFLAFLVCIRSDDAYIRYCGYRNMLDYVLPALYEASPNDYAAVMSYAPRHIRREMLAYTLFFEEYRDSVASNVSESVNNAYLTMQGTEGTKSYGMVVDLAVAYYRTPD